MVKKDETTLLVVLLIKSFYPFWPPLYNYDIYVKINALLQKLLNKFSTKEFISRKFLFDVRISRFSTLWKSQKLSILIFGKIWQRLKVNIFFLFVGEPNNDSPLNTQAANLWANQTAYKKHLHEKYEQEAKKASNSLWKMYKFRPLKFPYFSNQPTPYNEHFFLLVFQILRGKNWDFSHF